MADNEVRVYHYCEGSALDCGCAEASRKEQMAKAATVPVVETSGADIAASDIGKRHRTKR